MIALPDSSIRLVAEIPKWARHWRNNPAIRKWCRQYSLIDEASHAKWLERISVDESLKMFGVTVVTTAETMPDHDYDPDLPRQVSKPWGLTQPIGVAGLTSINRVNQSAEFSLYIGPEHQGKGYGKQALKTLLWHGFNHHNLNRIWGETFDGNPAIGMFESLGMKREGTLRESYFRDGKFIDSHIVSILRGEFHV